LAESNTPFLLRMPIIPGVNDNINHFKTAAEMIKYSKNLVRVDILPYQRAAGAKYEMVDKIYQPDFPEEKIPAVFPEVFDQMQIPYQVFK